MPYKNKANKNANYRKRYAEDNKFRDKESSRLKKYRKENPETVSVWFKENVYRTNITKKEWAKSNPQKVKESSAKCYKKHKREYQKKNRDYSRSHPEVSKAAKAKRRTRIAKGGGSFSAKQWLNLCNSYNNKCLCCKKRKRLEADHVIPVTKGGSSDISNIQPLCRSCNARKSTKTIDYRKQPESSAKRGGKN